MAIKPLKNLSEVAVIGGGLAGLAAARHAVRLGRLVTLFEGSGLYGGQVATVNHVEGLPFPGDHSGQDLAMALLEQVRKVGGRIIEAGIDRLEAGDRLTLIDGNGDSHHPGAVIVAAGASLRKLGVPGEEDYYGRGVSRCASCDGGFYRGQSVAVVGAGDAAFHEALTLAPLCGEVLMICRSPVRAKREYVDTLDRKENVRFVWDSEVTAILGGPMGVTGLSLRDVKSGAVAEVECAGVFPFIGVEPNSGFVPAKLVGADGLIKTDENYTTADPRIFAAGAIRGNYGGNAVEAMAEGTGAAAAAARYLAEQ